MPFGRGSAAGPARVAWMGSEGSPSTFRSPPGPLFMTASTAKPDRADVCRWRWRHTLLLRPRSWGRSTPCSIPSPDRKSTRSSVARFPVAPCKRIQTPVQNCSWAGLGSASCSRLHRDIPRSQRSSCQRSTLPPGAMPARLPGRIHTCHGNAWRSWTCEQRGER